MLHQSAVAPKDTFICFFVARLSWNWIHLKLVSNDCCKNEFWDLYHMIARGMRLFEKLARDQALDG